MRPGRGACVGGLGPSASQVRLRKQGRVIGLPHPGAHEVRQGPLGLRLRRLAAQQIQDDIAALCAGSALNEYRQVSRRKPWRTPSQCHDVRPGRPDFDAGWQRKRFKRPQHPFAVVRAMQDQQQGAVVRAKTLRVEPLVYSFCRHAPSLPVGTSRRAGETQLHGCCSACRSFAATSAVACRRNPPVVGPLLLSRSRGWFFRCDLDGARRREAACRYPSKRPGTNTQSRHGASDFAGRAA